MAYILNVYILFYYYGLLCLSAGATESTSASSASSSSSSSFVSRATSKNLPAVQMVAPMPEDTMESMRYNMAVKNPPPLTLSSYVVSTYTLQNVSIVLFWDDNLSFFLFIFNILILARNFAHP